MARSWETCKPTHDVRWGTPSTRLEFLGPIMSAAVPSHVVGGHRRISLTWLCASYARGSCFSPLLLHASIFLSITISAMNVPTMVMIAQASSGIMYS